MDDLNMSNIEQHIQGFHSQLRADYLGKVEEVARLHGEMAKLQIRLLDIEHENHMLKLQLAMAKVNDSQQAQPIQMPLLPPASTREESSKTLDSTLKRARSPSFEIIEMSEHSPKKLKTETKLESPPSAHINTASPTRSETQNFEEMECTQTSDSCMPSSLTTHLSPVFPDPNEQPKLELKRYKSEEPKVFSLPQSSTEMYLQNAKVLEIHPPPLDLQVRRDFLRIKYGGSDQQFLQYIQADRNPSGPFLRRLVFPMLDLNPSMPSRPGDLGLVFASRHEILSNPPWTLFCKRSKDKALWWYLGEYECRLVGTMTADDFKAQPPIVKREWAKRLLKQKLVEVYVSMRARIALRLASVIPMDDKDEETKLVQQEVKAIQRNKGRTLSEDDIVAAFCRGDEGIDIILMTCVKYDHNFANDMEARLTNQHSVKAKTKTSHAKPAGASAVHIKKSFNKYCLEKSQYYS